LKTITLCLSITLLFACASAPKFDGPVEDHIDVIFSAHKNKASYPAFKEALLVKFREFQNWKPNGYKAFAIAWDVGGRHAFGFGYGSNSVSVGGRFARNSCNKLRDQYGIEASCVIFAKEGRVVLESY